MPSPSPQGRPETVFPTEVIGLCMLLDCTERKNLVVTSAEFVYKKQTHIVRVKEEVICCASTNKSPQMFEVSGIGRCVLLSNIRVPVRSSSRVLVRMCKTNATCSILVHDCHRFVNSR
ncbi:uncharacterized protein LAESUDRAFT_212848 [Laetiporus sulphureus 93-53]|uniref:Uncharacterized protein n=1 Tax=Laetiporus sulphureus 93-53 TaxID=1314785 RepID=A0A165DVV8_9APHY|nr:uncharacterized protein LAESUDRAFT_212848 [Laetiporus sulphureus 93-53]KZT05735.1 hypothetical protein LAESUDRAFT_212848 [Laetiporus sulphureus 93-53]